MFFIFSCSLLLHIFISSGVLSFINPATRASEREDFMAFSISRSARGAAYTFILLGALSRITVRTAGTLRSVVMSNTVKSMLNFLYSDTRRFTDSSATLSKLIFGGAILFSQWIIKESRSTASQRALYKAIS